MQKASIALNPSSCALSRKPEYEMATESTKGTESMISYVLYEASVASFL